MQLNPARGRKLDKGGIEVIEIYTGGLCSSTPRGDGNLNKTPGIAIETFLKVYAAQPREGTETIWSTNRLKFIQFKVYAAQPREGTETNNMVKLKFTIIMYNGLCSSTPRGDGND